MPDAESDPCPACGSREWSTSSDGLGDVAAVVAVCVGCGYATSSTVDLTRVLPPGGGRASEVRDA